jgi:hypothetical protein
VTDLTKHRLIYLLLTASLFALILATLYGPGQLGMSDGGGLI